MFHTTDQFRLIWGTKFMTCKCLVDFAGKLCSRRCLNPYSGPKVTSLKIQAPLAIIIIILV